MTVADVLNVLLLVVVLYLAFRIGAVVLRILLGLLAIALFVWLIRGVFGI